MKVRTIPENALAIGIRDAAAMVGISRSTLYRFIAAGELKSFRAGYRRLISVAELQRWCREKQDGPAESEK